MEKSETKVDIKLFADTLMPSLTSAIWTLLVAVIISGVVITLTRYRTSSIHNAYLTYTSGHSLTPEFLNKSIFSTGILGNALIFAFWLAAGILVYLLAVDIVKGLQSTFALEKEMSYVHLNRSELLKYTLIRLFIRLITLGVLVYYLYLFFHKLLPRGAYLAIAASGTHNIGQRIGDGLLSILLIALSIHIALILLRLLVLKPRLFNNEIIK